MERRQTLKVLLVASLMVLCFLATHYYHFEKKEDVLFSHIFYLPIALAAVWWGMKSFYVSIPLAVDINISHLQSGLDLPMYHDVFRGLMFILVGLVIGLAVERKNKLQREYLKEHEQRMEDMAAHLTYVEQVAHELRNPLQVSLGVVDSLQTEKLPEDQQELLKMLNKSTGEILTRIKALTPDG